jgi:hypothetical protein
MINVIQVEFTFFVFVFLSPYQCYQLQKVFKDHCQLWHINVSDSSRIEYEKQKNTVV